MSIVSVDNIQPIGSGTTVTVNKSVTLESGNTNITGVATVSSHLTVSGELRPNGDIYISNSNPKIFLTDTNNDSDFHIENANGSFEIRDITNGADRVRIASDGTTDLLSNVNVSGDFSISDKIIHTGDTNTMIRFPSADTITAETAGGERLRIDSSGRIGIGENNPTRDIVIKKSGSVQVSMVGATNQNIFLNFGDTDDDNIGGVYYDNTNNRMIIRANTNDAVQVKSNGNMAINDGDLEFGTSGHGISFAATSDASGMANELLDDYEEGSFTPYIDRQHGSPIVGYDAQDGYYTKIGRVVYFYAEVRINSYNGNGSYGNTFLRGLPYNSAARTGGRGVWNSVQYNSYYRDIDTTDGERDIAVVEGSSEKVVFYVMRSENSWTAPPAPDSNDQFKIGGFYFT